VRPEPEGKTVWFSLAESSESTEPVMSTEAATPAEAADPASSDEAAGPADG
jgi:hypothetical protein